jgi:hypothetical protein
MASAVCYIKSLWCAVLVAAAAIVALPAPAAHACGADRQYFKFVTAGFDKRELSLSVDGGVAVDFFDNVDQPGSVTVTIDWGDGTPPTSSDPLPDTEPGHFLVPADHIYADEGTYPGTATVRGPCSGVR